MLIEAITTQTSEVHDKWGLIAVIAIAFFGTLNTVIQAVVARRVDTARTALAEKVETKFEETTTQIKERLGDIYVRVDGKLTRAQDVIRALTQQLELHGIKPHPIEDDKT